MEIADRKVNGILVLKLLDQRLDANIANYFKTSMANFINAGNHVLILNLSEVNFIDSSGLGSIISTLKTLGTRGDLVLCEMNDAVESMLKLTRMDRIFDLFKSEHDAIHYLKNKE